MKELWKLLLVLILISGCSTTGNQKIMNADFMQSLKIGATTKAEAQALLGEPTNKGLSEKQGWEVWRYAGEDRSVNAASFIPIVDLVAGRRTTRARVVDLYFDGEKLADIQSQSDMQEKVMPIGTIGAAAVGVGALAASASSSYYSRPYYSKAVVNTIPTGGGGSYTTIKWYK